MPALFRCSFFFTARSSCIGSILSSQPDNHIIVERVTIGVPDLANLHRCPE
jgi:hypothetical protein